jgi:hypothetical protein
MWQGTLDCFGAAGLAMTEVSLLQPHHRLNEIVSALTRG